VAINPSDIEARSYGVIPLAGGLDLTQSKALVTPGTLQDTLNYEVVSRGYTRAQGLLHYNGTYDAAVENMWYIGGLDVNTTIGGAGTFTLGGAVTWENPLTDKPGSGVCVWWDVDAPNNTKALGVVDIDGALPNEAVEFTDVETGTTFLVADDPLVLEDAVYFHNSQPIAGDITDYLAFINLVNTTIAAQTSSTWPNYAPNIPGTGAITGGFQFQDIVYAARDYMGAGFNNGGNKPDKEDILTIGGFTGKVAEVVLEAGSWEDGDAAGVILFEPHNGGTNDNTVFDTLSTSTTITNSTQANTVGAMLLSRNRNKGHLWKSTINGWNWLDLGYSIRFKEGENAPSAQVAPLFLPSIAGVTSAVQDTGLVFVSSATAVGDTGVYSAFNNVTNVYADDASVADSTLAASGKSQLIECNPTSYIDAEDAEIIGIEVALEASQTVGTDAFITSLRLVNDATGAVQYQSDNVADGTTLTTTPTVYTFGAQTDLWGMKGLTATDLNSGDVKIQVQFENGNGAATRTVHVDYVQIKVHYIARGQTLYFYDGSSDVATADVYAFERHDGDWDSAPAAADGDATGYMTLHNVSDPSAIVAGLTMRTDASGGGVLVAVTAGDISRNLLPSEAELTTEGSKWRTIEANFYPNDEGNGIYGATGAGSAFLMDVDDHFAFIRPPIAQDKDKPRHVAFHANHLALGMPSGHVMVSAIDVPNDFDTSGTATIWSFRDPVTGLNPLAGNALGVMCKESVNALLGTTAASGSTDPFRTQSITPKSGTLEYTVADVMGPMYADFSGVGTVATSDKFGDFAPGRLTVAIEDWTRDRFQNRPSSELADKGPVMGIPVRAKGQYRIYFEDGYILSLHLGDGQQPPQPMWSHMEPETLDTTYVPSWMDSTVLSTGRERVVMGDRNGQVWIVDGANGIQEAGGLTTVKCHITTNPVNTGFPQGSHKTHAITVLGDFMGAENITTYVGYDYLDVSSTGRTKEIGDYDAAPVFDAVPDYTDVFVQAFTDGLSFKIETEMDGSKPHTLHTLIQRFSRKGSSRNNTQVPR
jgi:hypothetical protein